MTIVGAASVLPGAAAEPRPGGGAPAFGPALEGAEFRGMAGVYAPIFTPYTKDNRINVEMLERMVEFQLAQGVRGFYTTGSTGESLLLTVPERKLVLETVTRANRGQGKIIAHVGCVRTDDSVELARHAADHGADWIASIRPVFFGQNAECAYTHYRRIAGATDRPFLIYCLNQALDPEAERRLFDIPNVKGMKYTGTDLFAVQRLQAALGKEAIFFVGHDPMLLPGLALGDVFSGGIGTTYNFAPGLYAELFRLARKGRFPEAARCQRQADRLIGLMLSHNENLSYAKAFMRYIGFDCGPARYPFKPISEPEYEAFAERIRALGILPCVRDNG